MTALGGANQIYGAGMIESGVSFDMAVLLMDNEWARMNKFVLRGIPVNDETLMVDEILAVGSDEDFLSRDLTLKLMRREQSFVDLHERRVREEWEMDGATDLYTRASRKVKELLEDYKPEPLPDDVADEIAHLVKEHEKKMGVA